MGKPLKEEKNQAEGNDLKYLYFFTNLPKIEWETSRRKFVATCASRKNLGVDFSRFSFEIHADLLHPSSMCYASG